MRIAKVGLIGLLVAFSLPLGAFEQKCDYEMDLALDPASQTLSGSEIISYTNNSEVTLTEVYLELFPNSFNPGTAWWDNYTKTEDAGQRYPYGYNPSSLSVESFRYEGQLLEARPATRGSTYARVEIPGGIAPGATAEFAVSFSYRIPQIFERSGLSDGNFHLIRFHPRIAVYDARGWNLHEHLTWGEFYGDFGSYRVTITLPSRYVVAASGSRTEARENADGTRTETHVIENAHNFVFAADPRYRREHAKFGDVSVNYYYYDSGGYAKKAIAAALKGLAYYSSAFGPYPYAEIDVVGCGPGAGAMEYPGLTMMEQSLFEIFPPLDRAVAETTMVHEIGHNWWYAAVGNDEYSEAWLDEGINTYSDISYTEDSYGSKRNLLDYPDWLTWMPNLSTRALAEDSVRGEYLSGRARPIAGPSGTFHSMRSYSTQVYNTAGLVLFKLQDLVGKEKFREFLAAYYMKYRFHHVTALDFFSLLSEMTGRDWTPFYESQFVRNELIIDEVTGLDGTASSGLRFSLLPDSPDGAETLVSLLPLPWAGQDDSGFRLGSSMLLFAKNRLSTGLTAFAVPSLTWAVNGKATPRFDILFSLSQPFWLLKAPFDSQTLSLSGDRTRQTLLLDIPFAPDGSPLSSNLSLGAAYEPGSAVSQGSISGLTGVSLALTKGISSLELSADSNWYPYQSVEGSLFARFPFLYKNSISLGLKTGYSNAAQARYLFSNLLLTGSTPSATYSKGYAALEASLTGILSLRLIWDSLQLNEIGLKAGIEAATSRLLWQAQSPGASSFDVFLALPVRLSLIAASVINIVPVLYLAPTKGFTPSFTLRVEARRYIEFF
jgi:hypothetical protein